jgi:bifunctional DNA-binding transcriptional regulator/antitoxin component of YhaV-PrlF toxin-antitoxin module
MTVLTIDESGTMTLPRETLLALGIESPAEVDVEVDAANCSLRVTPHYDDSWAQTEEFQAGLREALLDIEEGRVRRMSEDDLLRWVGLLE